VEKSASRQEIAVEVLEVVFAVSMKTLSNYVNHMAETPVDKQFVPQMNRRDGICQKPAMSRWKSLTRSAEGEQDASGFRPRVSYLRLESSANALRIEAHCAEVSVSRGSGVVVAASPICRTRLRAFHHPALRNARISFSIRRSLIWVSILTKNDTVGGSASGLKRKPKGF
jgi:hypothetical protein